MCSYDLSWKELFVCGDVCSVLRGVCMWRCVQCLKRSFVRGVGTYIEKGVFICGVIWRVLRGVCLWNCVQCLERSLFVGLCAVSWEEFVCGCVCSVLRGDLYVQLWLILKRVCLFVELCEVSWEEFCTWSCGLSWKECVCLWSCLKRLERSLFVDLCAMS